MAPVVGLGWSKQQQWKSWMMAMSRIEDVQGGRATPYFSRYGPGGNVRPCVRLMVWRLNERLIFMFQFDLLGLLLVPWALPSLSCRVFGERHKKALTKIGVLPVKMMKLVECERMDEWKEDAEDPGKVTIPVTGVSCWKGHHKMPDIAFFGGQPKCMNSSFLSVAELSDPGANLGGN